MRFFASCSVSMRKRGVTASGSGVGRHCTGWPRSAGAGRSRAGGPALRGVGLASRIGGRADTLATRPLAGRGPRRSIGGRAQARIRHWRGRQGTQSRRRRICKIQWAPHAASTLVQHLGVDHRRADVGGSQKLVHRADGVARPGLGLAKRGAGRGARGCGNNRLGEPPTLSLARMTDVPLAGASSRWVANECLSTWRPTGLAIPRLGPQSGLTGKAQHLLREWTLLKLGGIFHPLQPILC